MVIQATIYRLQDGLPLSASTDVDQRPEVRGCQKYIKLVSRRLAQLSDKCSLHLQAFHIHFISSLNLTFLVLCEASYPTVLAFSFLREIQKEFLVHHTAQQVEAARRPYAFIDYDVYLQKTKQRYNRPQTLAARVNLSDLNLEMKLRPVYLITEHDLGLDAQNGKITHRPTVVPGQRFVPLNWLGMLSVALSTVCIIINIMRGMTVIGHGHFDEDDDGAYFHGATFLFSSLLYTIQIYHTSYVVRWRLLQTVALLVLQAVCNYALLDFRNYIQVLFHMSVAIFGSVINLNRKLTEKLPGYSV